MEPTNSAPAPKTHSIAPITRRSCWSPILNQVDTEAPQTIAHKCDDHTFHSVKYILINSYIHSQTGIFNSVLGIKKGGTHSAYLSILQGRQLSSISDRYWSAILKQQINKLHIVKPEMKTRHDQTLINEQSPKKPQNLLAAPVLSPVNDSLQSLQHFYSFAW